jgi:uncharacterized protein (DUF1330 family)
VNIWSACATPMFTAALTVLGTPPANAAVCGSVGVTPHLLRVGGTVRYAGASPTVVVGEREKPWWDAIIVVEYPSPAAFLDMVTNEEYLKVHEHRAAGLDRGDLIATSIWTRAE